MTGPHPPSSPSYRKAGVDVDAGEALVRRIAPLAEATHGALAGRRGAEVLGGLGGFGGLLRLPDGYRRPVLVCGADGVGTKLLLAQRLGRYDTIGVDLVAMCANDILTHGARPLMFLDYYACGALDVDRAEQIVRGIADGCAQAGCALLGGETAEMPRLYAAEDYDLAGFCAGVAEEEALLPRKGIGAGDVLIGVASSGAHANGYSLIHKVLDRQPEADPHMLEQLLVPTRIYRSSIAPSLEAGRILALAHITGGGIDGNLPRILPPGARAVLRPGQWETPELFAWLQRGAGISAQEMRRIFNCGLGMIAAVRADDADRVRDEIAAAGADAWIVGEVAAGDGAPFVEYAP